MTLFLLLLLLLGNILGKSCGIPEYDNDDDDDVIIREVEIRDIDGLQTGTMRWPSIDKNATLFVQDMMISNEESTNMMNILREVTFDEDLDSVDGMSTFEFYIYSHNDYFPRGKPDRSEKIRTSRKKVRSRIRKITDPITRRVEDVVNKIYKDDKCGGGEDAPCQVCYSFVRRYLDTERTFKSFLTHSHMYTHTHIHTHTGTTHRDHLDIKSMITVVMSLNRYGQDYTGGLYVRSGGSSERFFVPLHPTRAVIHTSDILHGVDVMQGERWSFIMWISNDSNCDPNASRKWHLNEAKDGDPMAMFLHAKRTSSSSSSSSREALEMMKKAAESGFARAMNEFGMWKREGSHGVVRNISEATSWFKRAVDLGEEDAALNLGQVLLSDGDIEGAVELFRVAAQNGSSAARMNMGVAYFKGAGGCERNLSKAMSWFLKSNSANGLWQVFQTLQIYNREKNRTGKDQERCWLKRAAMAGHESAIQLEAAHSLKEDDDVDSSIRWYKKLAQVATTSTTRAMALSTVEFLVGGKEL